MRRLAVLLTLPLLLACAPLEEPLAERRDSQAYREFQVAKTLQKRDPAQAARALRRFLVHWPGHPLADDAAYLLAHLERRAGELEAAEQRLAWLLREYPRGARAQEARVLLAQIQLERGDTEAAARTAGEIRFTRLSPAARRAAHRVRAEIARERGDGVERLRWLSWLRADTPDADDLALVDLAIDELIAALGRHELEAAAEQLGKRTPAARARLRIAELLLGEGDPEGARMELARAGRLPMSPVELEHRNALRARLADFDELEVAPDPGSWHGGPLAGRIPPSTRGARGTLGVVLPLSGSFAAYGEESLQGILLAAGAFGDDPAVGDEGRVRLLVRDSGGTPARAAAAVGELGRNSDVAAIVGPLLGDESEAAARAAEEAGVPLVALTAREEVARGRPQVVRVGLSPRSEARLLASYATARLGARRFAILYPRDVFGLALKDLFWDAVEARGGRITALASYDPEANDFAEPIRSLVGYRLLTGGEQAALAQREKLRERAKRLPYREARALREQAEEMTGRGGAPLPPIVDFDVLFVPDSHEKVELIAPQLAFHEVLGVRLLGPAGWYHPDLVRIGGRHVEGAVFTESFHPTSSSPFVVAFAERFRTTFARTPGSMAAQAFDAANLVLVQLAAGRTSRDGLRRGLLATRGYPGVSGLTTVLADGNAEKQPFLLAVHDGEIVRAE